MKTCSKCGQTKPLDEFSNRNRSRDGKESQCKQCIYAYSRSEAGISARRKYRKSQLGKKNKKKYLNKASESARAKKSQIQARADLTDGGIKRSLCNIGIKAVQITPEIIELKREQLLIYRATKQLIKEIQNGTK